LSRGIDAGSLSQQQRIRRYKNREQQKCNISKN
jgi:hypothetical protein